MSRTTRAFVIIALFALVAAALLHALVLAGVMRVWPAMVHLSLFGWITGMILAVNYHMLPVFSGRDFPFPRLMTAHWLTFAAGIALATAGLLLGQRLMTVSGVALQTIAAAIFVINTVTLFTRGRQTRTPPVPPVRDQKQIDRVGTQATKLAGMSLPLALLMLLAVYAGVLRSSWLLAAEHLATLGWILLMIVGVAQHVLPRFSGRPLRGVGWSRAQLLTHTLALALMVPALGFGWTRVFAAGGSLMSIALLLFAWTVWPALVTIGPRIALRFREQAS
jgi:hypothetical protein